MSHICHFYHIVFSTKERRPLIDGPWQPRLIEYIGGIIRNLKGEMVKCNAIPDHIHIATSVPATIAVSEFVNKVKSNSSGWVHRELNEKCFGWQDGYASFCVSPSVLPAVIRYITTQQEHHKRQSFQAELIELLTKHGVKYDERYM
jgi:REP element-mobilizing transposase RayT